jgi:hypothetical protein
VVRRVRSRIALIITVVSLVFSICCLILPEISTEQTMLAEGPTTPYGQADYTFSGYVIPPVPLHSEIIVAIDGYIPNSLTFSMFPAASGNLAPTGPALIAVSNFSGAPFRVTVNAPVAEPYAIFVSSTNRTSFAIAIKGTWSLFYVLRGYIFEGFFATLGALLATYYFRTVENRKALEEEAVREATSHGAGGGAARLWVAHS